MIANHGRLKPIIFVHIPKASGTTISKLLRRWFEPREIYEVGTKAREEDATELRRLPKPRLILGHAAFGLHEALHEPATYVTVLRDPVSRLISHYHYAGRTPMHPLHQRIRNGELTLCDVARRLPNLQTRYIGGLVQGNPTEQTLEQAKANIDRHFGIAGLAERFDETVMLLHRKFHQRVWPFVSENVSPRSPSSQIMADELREVRSQNTLDYELYDFVRTRFDRAVKEEGLLFPQSVKVLRIANRFADRGRRTFLACRALAKLRRPSRASGRE